MTGMGGLGHDFKAGVNWIHEPHLFATFNGGATPQLTLNSDSLTSTGPPGARSTAAPPTSTSRSTCTPLYVQDDWRVTDRLTLNLGLRYDYVDGMPIDQDREPELPGRCRPAGAPAGSRTSRCSRTSARAPRNDGDNIQPRVGFAYDLRGNGRDIIRGGWGVYTDFGYTNSNVLFPAIDAAGGHGQVFFVNNPTGIRKADGSFYTRGRPDLVDRLAERGRPDAGAALRPGGLAAARAAVHASDQPRLGAPARLVDGAHRRLRARRRPRHQHPLPSEHARQRRPAPSGRSAPSARTRCRSARRSARARAPTTRSSSACAAACRTAST